MPLSDSFDRILKKLKAISTPIPRVGVDDEKYSMILDQEPIFRVDVFTEHWERLKKKFEKVS